MPETRLSARTTRLFLAMVVLAALALHARTIGFGFSYLDDDALILEQQATLTEPSAVWRAFARPYFSTSPTLPSSGRDHAYYRPLVTASFALDAAWSGSHPRGYHVTNVLLAALGAGLLFRLLLGFGYRPGVALFGGLVYAVHPALTEAVAWIPGRNDSLLVVFALAAWLLLGYSIGTLGGFRTSRDGVAQAKPARPHATALPPRRWGSRLAHLLAWLAALLCKETALVLPLVYAGHLVLIERRPLRSLAAPWLLAGWGCVLALYLVARAYVLPDHLGAAGVTAGSFASSVSLLVSSLGKLVLPVHLSVMATPEDGRLWPGIVAACALAAIAFVPGVRRRHVVFALACFVAFVLPGAPASRMLALESRLALPAIAIVLIACEVADRLAWPPRTAARLAALARSARVRLPEKTTERFIAAQLRSRKSPSAATVAHRAFGAERLAAGAVLTAGLAAVTFSYAGSFRDRLSFAQAAVSGAPHSALAHRNLGVAHHLAGQTALARREYEAAVAADAGEPIVHNNLAVMLMAEGRLPEAEQELRAELSVNPNYAVAHDNLARVLAALGRAQEAEREQATAAKLRRDGEGGGR